MTIALISSERSVVVEGTKIVTVADRTDVPRNARVIDCTGLTISAGFWNSHVHFMERKWANAAEIPAAELQWQLFDTFTRYGFTTVFDLGSDLANTRAIRDRIESGEVAGPRILTTGPGIVAPNMLPSDDVYRVMGVMRFAAPEVSDAAQATAAVNTLVDQGVDAIKLFPIAEPAMAAAVDAAHRRGKLVFLHPNRGDDALAAIRSGVDVIAHTTPFAPQPIDPRVALTPTLHIWRWFQRHDRISQQEKVIATTTSQLRDFFRAGGTVLFGTDLGAVDPDPAGEYELMRMSGMTSPEILASLTTAPAARFGQRFDADLVVFGDDFTDVRYVVSRGVLHEVIAPDLAPTVIPEV